MSSVLIVHASRHGGTTGIAERIAEVLGVAGFGTTLAKAGQVPDPVPYDACVIGSGVYMGSWLKDGIEYLERYGPALAERPVWLFSSGPLPGSTKGSKVAPIDPIEAALGPSKGPGSGGRRRIEDLSSRIHPRDHRVFEGRFDPADPPGAMSERLLRMMPGSKGILPPGDFRDWPAIEAWAREIAKEIATLALEPELVGSSSGH